ncbi:MAG TPA: phytanoyl-CoA dioxygenase family protein [Abditibacteriaceae bacterium]|jgi:ectoine hydroxylase-related dioxygenase (phytanoyl-CoA dioxygenase family)
MLTEQQLEFYRENGYILVEGVFDAEECAVYRDELHAFAERLGRQRDIDATWGSARAGVAGAQHTKLLHSHDVQFYLASMARLIVDKRLTEPASQIIGPNVQLHHTKMFIKPPEKGSPFPMHQDEPYFPHVNHSMIAAIIHFDDAPLEKGCVRVVPGSHKKGPIPHEGEGSWHLPFDDYPVESAVPCPAKAGDVLFFSYLTIHGSGINVSDQARTTMLVQMRDPADTPTIRTHESRGQGMILHGIDPLETLPEPTGAMGGGMGGAMGGMGKM